MSYLDIDHVAFEDKKMLIYIEMKGFHSSQVICKYLNDVKNDVDTNFFKYFLVSSDVINRCLLNLYAIWFINFQTVRFYDCFNKIFIVIRKCLELLHK